MIYKDTLKNLRIKGLDGTLIKSLIFKGSLK